MLVYSSSLYTKSHMYETFFKNASYETIKFKVFNKQLSQCFEIN